jgi:hypothetical protein
MGYNILMPYNNTGMKNMNDSTELLPLNMLRKLKPDQFGRVMALVHTMSTYSFKITIGMQ